MKPAALIAVKTILGLGGLTVLFVYSSGACSPRVKPGHLAEPPLPAVPAGAAVLAVAASALTPATEIVGTVESEGNVNLCARIPAYVNTIRVDAGSRVKQGELLATLDDREVQEQLAAATAQLRQADAEYTRTKRLFDTQAATEQQLLAVETTRAGAKAQVERVNVMLSYTRVVAPCDGIVIDKRVTAGDLANPGQLLLTVYDPTRMRLAAPVPVRLVEKVKLGQTVAVQLDWPAQALAGTVTQIVSEVDPHSRTQTVRIRLAGATGEILPGTFGRFTIAEEPRPALLLPAAAVTAAGQLELVQVVTNGQVSRRLVKTVPAGAGQREILAGLTVGEQVLLPCPAAAIPR